MVEDDFFGRALRTVCYPDSALPLALVWQLTRTAGIAEEVVAGMTKEQAVEALNNHRLSKGS